MTGNNIRSKYKPKAVSTLTIAFFADIIKHITGKRGGFLHGIKSVASGMSGGLFKYYAVIDGII